MQAACRELRDRWIAADPSAVSHILASIAAYPEGHIFTRLRVPDGSGPGPHLLIWGIRLPAGVELAPLATTVHMTPSWRRPHNIWPYSSRIEAHTEHTGWRRSGPGDLLNRRFVHPVRPSQRLAAKSRDRRCALTRPPRDPPRRLPRRLP